MHLLIEVVVVEALVQIIQPQATVATAAQELSSSNTQ
jgi:hypothetical protein